MTVQSLECPFSPFVAEPTVLSRKKESRIKVNMDHMAIISPMDP